ncbi:MAG: elongation factor, partial [Petrotoga sp.]|nr:elongation factor [Petrotoga sp.]
MSEYNAEKKRIVGFFGHHGCGKTTLMDDVLVNLGLTDRIGQRHLDKDPVEKEK